MRSLITSILCLISIASHSKVIVVDKALPYDNQGKSVSYFKDNNASLSLTKVIEADREGKFLYSQSSILNFGNTKSAYWLKVTYLNKASDQTFLILDIANIESIDFYIMDGVRSYKKIHSGSIAPKNPHVIASNNYIFPLPEKPYSANPEVVYVRLRTNNVLIVPVKMATSEGLLGGLNSFQRIECIFIGLLVALFFFNISVYARARDITYLYYSIYIASLIVYLVLYFRGYSYLMGYNFRYYLNAYPHVVLSLGTMAGIAFSYKFLNLKTVLPKSMYIIWLLVASWTLVLIVSLLGYKSLSCDLSQVLTAVSTVTVWVIGIIAYSKGYKPALYYVIGWAFMSVATVWLIICMAYDLPYVEFSLHLAPFGLVCQLLLFSMAMGDRFKELKKSKIEVQSDKLKIQEENLYLVNSQNERLEKVVESRTRALKKIVQSLEAANADKNRLFSIIAHDLRSPFNSLISLFSLNDMDMLTFEDVKMLLNDSRRNIDNIHNTLNNLLYWAQSQMQGITTEPSRFNMRILVEDLMMVYQPLLKKKAITTDIVIQDDADVFADLNQIKLVMRNLIDNAIKFTPLNRHIHLRIWGNGDYVYVDVCNPVAGTLNLDQLADRQGNHPSYGTSNERGVGLGLHLCRDFVEKNKGHLKVSKEDECIVLRFNLPKFVSESSAISFEEEETENVPL